VIDTLNSSAETAGTDDDQESKKVDNDSVEDTLEDVESVSVAGTDVSGSSDGNNKTAVSKVKGGQTTIYNEWHHDSDIGFTSTK